MASGTEHEYVMVAIIFLVQSIIFSNMWKNCAWISELFLHQKKVHISHFISHKYFHVAFMQENCLHDILYIKKANYLELQTFGDITNYMH